MSDRLEDFLAAVRTLPEITPEVADAALKADRYAILKRAAKGLTLTAAQRAIVAESLGDASPSSGARFASNKVEAAAELNISRPTLDSILKRMARKKLPVPKRADGSWELQPIRAFMREVGIKNGGPIEPTGGDEALSLVEQMKTELFLLKLESAKIDLEERKGQMLDMKEMVKQTVEAFGTIRYQMLSRWDALAVQLAGRTVPEIKKRGRAADIEILLQFSGGNWPDKIKDMVRKFLIWMEGKE